MHYTADICMRHYAGLSQIGSQLEYCRLSRVNHWYIVAYEGLINGTGFGNWFRAKYLKLRLLHHPFALQELYVIALFYVIYLLY